MIYKLTKQKELPSGSPGPKYLQLFQRMDPGSIPKAQDPSRHAGELVPWSSSVHLGLGNVNQTSTRMYLGILGG